jgi:hypothetical protein
MCQHHSEIGHPRVRESNRRTHTSASADGGERIVLGLDRSGRHRRPHVKTLGLFRVYPPIAGAVAKHHRAVQRCPWRTT